MTETCGAATGNPASAYQAGSIGPALPFNEVRIDPATNEILVRGTNVFRGYLNLPEKTAETIDADGWLHTGDVGSIDADGYFRITDRMKDIIITAGGKNITPSEIENELKFSPYVTDAVLVGDRRRLSDRGDHDRPGERREVRAGPRRAVLQLRQPDARAAGAGADPARDRPREREVRARRADQEASSCSTSSSRAEDEELTPTMKLKRKLVQAEVRAADRVDVPLKELIDGTVARRSRRRVRRPRPRAGGRHDAGAARRRGDGRAAHAAARPSRRSSAARRLRKTTSIAASAASRST